MLLTTEIFFIKVAVSSIEGIVPFHFHGLSNVVKDLVETGTRTMLHQKVILNVLKGVVLNLVSKKVPLYVSVEDKISDLPTFNDDISVL